MSITQGPGFRANETISAYIVVASNVSSTTQEIRIEVADTSTSVPVGISQDIIQPEASGDIATDGYARLLLATTTAAGDRLMWQTATGQGMPVPSGTLTVSFFAVALAPGTNGSIIPVQIRPNLLPNI